LCENKENLTFIVRRKREGGIKRSHYGFSINGFLFKIFFDKKGVTRLLCLSKYKGIEMTRSEQVTAFTKDVDALVKRYCSEFDLEYIDMAGVLHEAQFYLLLEASGLLHDEEDEDEEDEF
tara:strand:+ start:1340 stop:1699 length:360 start_codon:yes stop_codon:yes gene_type:complete